MAKDSGRSSRFPKSGDEEDHKPRDEEEDSKGLMAEIDSGVGTGDDDPAALPSLEPKPAPKQEPPEKPPAYTPPITERWGRLMSRVNHPLEVKTKEGAIRLSPRQIVRVDGNKLGDVPTGARFVPDRR